MATLTVGADKQFRTISAAVSAARSGDTVAIDAGTYTNDFPAIGNKALTLQGVGGLAHMTATANPPNGKGALVPTAGLTVENMEFSSWGEGSGGNTSGIRHEGGPLVIRNSYFHDNQSGLLSTPQPGNPAGSVRIENSEFARNGDGSGQTHNIYVNEQSSFTAVNLYSHDARGGHNLKSRAQTSEITDSRLTSEANDPGVEAYSLDFPNGGTVTIRDSVIQQGADAGNRGMVSYGAEPERTIWANGSVTLDGNTAVDDSASSASFFANWTGAPATISNTKVWGLTDAEMVTRVETTTAVTGTTRLAARPADNEASPIGGAVSPPPPTAPPPPTGTAWTGTSGANTRTGGEGADTMNGGGGNDTLSGAGGNDALNGGARQDVLRGGAGNDSINGGAGADQLYGDAGADRFVFSRIGHGNDRIGGFNTAEGDALDLRAVLGAGAEGDSVAELRSGGYVSLLEASGRVTVRVDADGGGNAYTSIATLQGTSVASVGDGGWILA